jgi:two-component sensor histidine kinase
MLYDRGHGFLERLPLATARPVLGFGVALLAVAAAHLLRMATTPVLPSGYPFVTFVPVVMLVAFLLGWRPGLVAALAGGACSLAFILPDADPQHPWRSILAPMIFYTSIVATELLLVFWMQRSNTRLRRERERSAMLVEKSNLLFRELQHRVSNNLQVVAALLTLQKRHVQDAQARAAIDEASRRLALIGRIHRQLHDPSGARIAMAPFLDQLARDLIDAAGRASIRCTVDADESIVISPDSAIPLALIVAESVSNALEHGFADCDTGTMRIALSRRGAEILLEVEDDGCGIAQDFDLAQAKSLGLRIATTLARQLEGRFELLPGQAGAVARLTLPA